MSPSPLAVSILGAGVMGGNHARTLANLPGATLHRIFDTDSGRAATLAGQAGGEATSDLNTALAGADAVVIAASSAAHAGLAQAVIAAGKPLLIEKPFAVTVTEAEAVISAAERAGVPVATGHVERFNPAFVAAQKLLSGRRILAIDGRRLNVGSNRILDTDVVIDLMIHDIDAAVALMGGVAEGLMAQGFALAEGTAKRDHVLAAWTQRTPLPIRVTMQGSRIVPDRVRETRVLTEEGMVVIDFLNRRVQASECLLPDGQSEGRSLVPVAVQPQESLAAELVQFLDAIRAGKPEAVGVTVQAALPVLSLVWAIQDQLYGA